jgi:hypothetical protein
MLLSRFFERLKSVVRVDDAKSGHNEVVAVHQPRAQIVFDDQDQGALGRLGRLHWKAEVIAP